MPDAGSRAARWKVDATQTRPSDDAQRSTSSIVKVLARIHHTAAVSTVQARAMAEKAQIARDHARKAALLGHGLGCASMSCVVLTIIPNIIGYISATIVLFPPLLLG